jgi:hypothetical protein
LDFFVDLILNLDLAPQKVLPPMQDEHGDAIEKNEWVHEGSKRCYKVNACTNSYVAKLLFCKHLDQTHGLCMQWGRFKHPSTHLRGLKQQDHISMNVFILDDPHTKQKWNEKKFFDQIFKK